MIYREIFFKPNAKNNHPKRMKNKKISKLKNQEPWTNKQRQSFAREHWEIHHGINNKSTTPALGTISDPNSTTSAISSSAVAANTIKTTFTTDKNNRHPHTHQQ